MSNITVLLLPSSYTIFKCKFFSQPMFPFIGGGDKKVVQNYAMLDDIRETKKLSRYYIRYRYM